MKKYLLKEDIEQQSSLIKLTKLQLFKLQLYYSDEVRFPLLRLWILSSKPSNIARDEWEEIYYLLPQFWDYVGEHFPISDSNFWHKYKDIINEFYKDFYMYINITTMHFSAE